MGRTGSSRAGFLLGAILLLCTPAAAQRYHVHAYTEGDGLPSSDVHGVGQDPAGRMWFATRAGVAVYDGFEWTTYGVADGLDAADRKLLVFDDRGLPWTVASNGRDVARFDGTRWETAFRPQLPDGCAIKRLEVLGLEPVPRLALGTTCGLLLWDGEAAIRLGEPHGLPAEIVTGLARIGTDLYVATPGGLVVLAQGSERPRAPGFATPDDAILTLARETDAHGRPVLWIVGAGWIAKRVGDDPVQVLVRDAAFAGGRVSWVACADGWGGVLFGNPFVVHRYDPSTGLETLDERSGLGTAGTVDVFRDREGCLWVASPRGVTKIVGFHFATYGETHGLYGDEVSAVLERRDREIVLGHVGGLTRIGRDGPRTIDLRDPRVERVLARVLDLAESPDGTLWIAGTHLGLGRLDGRGIAWWTPDTDESIDSVLVDRRGWLWVAGRSLWVDRGAGPDPLRFDGQPDFRRLVEGSDGAIWALSVMSGIHRHDLDGRWTNLRHPSRADANSVYALIERPDGEVWVGSGAGLLRIAGDRLEFVERPSVRRPVYFLVAEEDGRTWFGTDNGVLRWDGTTLEAFSVEDGLAGRETNRAAGLVASDGRLWIGTSRGVTIYRRELDRPIAVPPLVELVGVDAAGHPIGVDLPVELGHRSNDLTFTYRATSFRDEQRLRVQTRLEGFEVAWSPPRRPAGRSVRFTNLPPGHYRFQVRAASHDGAWSDVVSSQPITILSPIWSRGWFWGVVLVGLLGLSYGVARHFAERRHARALEAEVRDRVAELRRAEAELEKAQRLEALGVLAGGIAHDFNNLLTVVLGTLSSLGPRVDGEARRSIADATTAVKRANELSNQLLTFARGGAPVRRAARVADVIRESVAFALHGSNVRAEVEIPPALRTVEVDTGQINQVLNNLLINAVQAMPDGGVVRIAARDVEGGPPPLGGGPYVAIAVRDDGPGIDEDTLGRIFDPYFSTKKGGTGLGLATAYSIARRHDGLLTVDSRSGAGTTFTLWLPASVTASVVDPPAESDSEIEFAGARALVMDDDEGVRSVVEAILRSLGCEVAGTRDGAAALERYAESLEQGRRFDVVVLDLTVPGGMGGEETMRRLREIDPQVTAIVASGYADATVMSSHAEHGFRAALCKPFGRDELAVTLARVLGRGPSAAPRDSPVGVGNAPPTTRRE